MPASAYPLAFPKALASQAILPSEGLRCGDLLNVRPAIENTLMVTPFRLPFCVVLGSCCPPGPFQVSFVTRTRWRLWLDECRFRFCEVALGPAPILGERINLFRSFRLHGDDGSNTGSLPGHDDLLGVEPDEVSSAPHSTPLWRLMTSLYTRGGAVPPLTGGMGIAPIIGQTVTLSPFGYLRRSYSLTRFRANGSHILIHTTAPGSFCPAALA